MKPCQPGSVSDWTAPCGAVTRCSCSRRMLSCVPETGTQQMVLCRLTDISPLITDDKCCSILCQTKPGLL